MSAISTVGQRNAITDCWRVLGDRIDLDILALEEETLHKVAARCMAMAHTVTDSSPTFSFAWYIGSLANAYLQNWTEFNRQLTLSQQTGAYEQWIGSYRVALAESNLSRLDAPGFASHEIDLAMLVTTGSGVASIAERYASDPAFRDRITNIVATVPQADQRRFLHRVRELAGQ